MRGLLKLVFFKKSPVLGWGVSKIFFCKSPQDNLTKFLKNVSLRKPELRNFLNNDFQKILEKFVSKKSTIFG